VRPKPRRAAGPQRDKTTTPISSVQRSSATSKGQVWWLWALVALAVGVAVVVALISR
jgi:hypothetical protein